MKRLCDEIIELLDRKGITRYGLGFKSSEDNPNRVLIWGSKRELERIYALLDYDPGGEPGSQSPLYEFQFSDWSIPDTWLQISRKLQAEGDTVGLISEEVVRKIDRLVYEGLRTDGGHHKQWYLFQIGELLGIDLSDADPGVAP